ncbi:MAG: WD40/YVTN/BNR-like repeat-containing protein [Gammaproteobacteria bacterium]
MSALLLLANAARPLYAGEVADPGVSTPLASRLLLLDVAVTGPRIVAVGERGYILFSEDGGASWHRAEAPKGATLTGITFFGEDLGWAVGHDATILRSTDGGRRWRRVHAEREGERALFDVWFANERHGLAVGAYGLLLESTDGGERWMRRTLDIYQAGPDGGADGGGAAAGRGGDPSAFDLPETDRTSTTLRPRRAGGSISRPSAGPYFAPTTVDVPGGPCPPPMRALSPACCRSMTTQRWSLDCAVTCIAWTPPVGQRSLPVRTRP